MSEGKKEALMVDFEGRLRQEFHGVKVNGDAGLPAYRILEWDSDFFDFTVAQISLPDLNASQLENVLSELRRNNVKLAYWQSAKGEAHIDPDQVTEFGGRLVDEKVTFLADLNNVSPLVDGTNASDVVVESYHSSMSKEELRALAIQSGEFSRFAVDPNIPRAKFEEMYTIWIDKSLAKEIADEVLVIHNEDRCIMGMTTLRRKGTRGDIGLIAVDLKFRGKGIGEMLVRHAQKWFLTQGYSDAQIVTQGVNEPACRLYSKCGYSVEKVEYYYHFWL